MQLHTQKAMFSSGSSNWGTPFPFVRQLEKSFNRVFDLDPCVGKQVYAKAPKFYTPADNGLLQQWFGNVFGNWPWAGDDSDGIEAWLDKTVSEVTKGEGNIWVASLTPARTDTKWFHHYVFRRADAVYFIKGRIQFIDMDTGAPRKGGAPFPVALGIYNNRARLGGDLHVGRLTNTGRLLP